MGFFQQIAGRIGGAEHIERFARGEMSFDRDGSPDVEHWNQLVTSAPAEDVQESMAHAARQVDGQEYEEHITPGLRGTDPLGGLGQGALSALAGSLLGNLLGGGGRDAGSLLGTIPGLRTTDPNQMTADEVARLATYTRQHDPDAFGRSAAEVGRQQPGLLQSLLGNKALMLGAVALAAKVMAGRQRRVA